MNTGRDGYSHGRVGKASGVDALAIFGAGPAFSEALHVGRPNIGPVSQLQEYVRSICERRWFTNDGPLVQDFERSVADRLGIKHCIAVCNGTVALELAIRGVGLSGEVIVPSFTFVATANALRWQGIQPVFCDIERSSHNLDPQAVERLISPKTTGILGVHLWGRPCAIGALSDIAARYGLTLIFDSAHAFGCSHQGCSVGSFGAAEVFSFHATKVVHTGEGGAIVTNDDELAGRLRLMRNFGFIANDQVVYLGINGKMSELNAAMGLTNLTAMDDFIAANRANYRRYRERLADIPGISFVVYDEEERCNYQYIVLEWDEDIIGLSRDAAVAVLSAENILARRYFYPGVHRMEPYRSEPPADGWLLPETERIASRVLVLPNGSAMTVDAVDAVCQVIRTAAGSGRIIGERLAIAA